MPDITLLEKLSFSGSAFLISIAVLALFWNGDSAISEEMRSDLSKYLLRLKGISKTQNSIETIKSVFDRLFDSRYFSIRRILASFIASTIIFILSLSLWISIDYSLFVFTFGGKIFELEGIIGFLIIFFVYNLLGDFISISETRYMMGKMNEINFFILLIIDFIFTLLIFILITYIFLFLVFLYGDSTDILGREISPNENVLNYIRSFLE